MLGFQLFSYLENPLTKWWNTVNYCGPLWSPGRSGRFRRGLDYSDMGSASIGVTRCSAVPLTQAMQSWHDLKWHSFFRMLGYDWNFVFVKILCSNCFSTKLWSFCTSLCLHVLLNVLSGDWKDGKHGTKRWRSGLQTLKPSSFQVISFITWKETWFNVI